MQLSGGPVEGRDGATVSRCNSVTVEERLLTMDGWQKRMRMWHAECEVVDDLGQVGPEPSPQQGCRKYGEERGALLSLVSLVWLFSLSSTSAARA